MASTRGSSPLLMILSPAKTMNFASCNNASFLPATQPQYAAQAAELVQQLRAVTKKRLSELMSISDSLAAQTHSSFKSFDTELHKQTKLDVPTTEDSSSMQSLSFKQCAFTYDGPAYRGLCAPELSKSALEYLQGSLRIITGLYGCLRPSDAIQPYRLEMGTRIAVEASLAGAGTSVSCKDLYEYWEKQGLGDRLAKEAASTSAKLIVNLASNEYARVLSQRHAEKQGVQLVDVVFKHSGRVIAVHAKRARGLLARYIAETACSSLDDVTKFDWENWRHQPTESTPTQLVFARSSAPAKKPADKTKAKTAASSRNTGGSEVRAKTKTKTTSASKRKAANKTDAASKRPKRGGR